jgi:hypothetical protein
VVQQSQFLWTPSLPLHFGDPGITAIGGTELRALSVYSSGEDPREYELGILALSIHFAFATTPDRSAKRVPLIYKIAGRSFASRDLQSCK